MRKIRFGMFETNSSSAHSIVISSGKCNETLFKDKNGIVKVEGGEFGWEIKSYYSSKTKASYCLTYAKQARNEEWVEMLRNVIQEHTKASSVEFIPCPSKNKYYEWGYIDHQSGPKEGGAGSDAFASEKSLKQFIFCPQSILHTDNDND